jgi:2-oxoacid:acceptor oxidoreductase gamma subunit (pyruvate/2-ketoisovalerate family)
MSQKSSLNGKLLEIRWHGRGGQGAITAAKIVAQAAYQTGYRGITAAPSFGAERRGAPVSASTRISNETVLVVSQVETPDIVVVLDHTLLAYPDVSRGLCRNGWLIVNSPYSPRDLGLKGEFRVATADATRVCQELGLIVAGLVIVNTAILGALLRATKLVEMSVLEKVTRERFSNSAAEINLSAINKTYKITKVSK